MRDTDTLVQAAGHIRGVQCCAGVEHDDIGRLLAIFRLSPAKCIAYQRQRTLGIVDVQPDQALALDAEVFRLDLVFADLAILQLSHEGGRGQADFVQPVLRMNDQHVGAAQARQHLGHRPAEFLAEHAEDLVLDPGWIGHRAEDIEQGAQA